eukprot:TRINITY_DN67819_c2_g4_i1.p1 TRINITY_DN67819_c2_g4~~TRINITY_DN67819_c2_g4_i1.p1  ORF type:complete len:333 (-),score=44.07 TRINITY_DN67819_c2_g4_i1:2350-3300(-)
MHKFQLVLVFSVLLSLSNCSLHDEFKKFKTEFGKKYHTLKEEIKAGECFMENLIKIEKLNREFPNAHYGINKFADMCEQQFSEKYLNHNGHLRPESKGKTVLSGKQHPVNAKMPTSWDWRTKGAVTPVKNEGQTGSVWVYASSSDMSSALEISTGTMRDIGTDFLVKCITAPVPTLDIIWKWVIKHGIPSKSENPFKPGESCAKLMENATHPFHGYHNFADKNEHTMAEWVWQKSPIAVAVDAAGWQTYMGGVMENCSGRTLDHVVLIVGYGVAGNTPYWIAQNSWGTSWGENGYIRIKRGVNCDAIAEDASTITV